MWPVSLLCLTSPIIVKYFSHNNSKDKVLLDLHGSASESATSVIGKAAIVKEKVYLLAQNPMKVSSFLSK